MWVGHSGIFGFLGCFWDGIVGGTFWGLGNRGIFIWRQINRDCGIFCWHRGIYFGLGGTIGLSCGGSRIVMMVVYDNAFWGRRWGRAVWGWGRAGRVVYSFGHVVGRLRLGFILKSLFKTSPALLLGFVSIENVASK